jgi:ABC-type nitrate/sulfonate/bicarbonate transport system substrate-binding protein
MTSQTSHTLNAIVFPGVQNLPHFAADANGFYVRRGLAVTVTLTRSSHELRDGLRHGQYDIAHSAVDNALAMVDIAGADIAIVIGLDLGFNKLVVQPEIISYDMLCGKTLGVDANDTAFALIAYDVLKRKGLGKSDYKVQEIGATRFRLEALKNHTVDFAMLNLPFNVFAQRDGLTILDNPNEISGPYQSHGGFVRRAWAKENSTALTAYLAAYIEGLRWSLDASNRAAAIALLTDRMKLPTDIAEECFNQVSDVRHGFRRDAQIDLFAMQKLLQLRANFRGQAQAASPGRYIDESYYQNAIASL